MNQLENTPENKATFFALYWGQKVLCRHEWPGKDPVMLSGKMNWYYGDCNGSYLSLRSIGSLTDKEMIFCFDMLFANSGYTNEVKIDLVKDWCRLINKETGGFLPKNYVTFIDYLRKISVFIPYMGESDKLIEWGWVKILK